MISKLLTFQPLSRGPPTRRTQSTAELLKINMTISVLIEGQEGSLDGGARHGRREQGAHAGSVQLSVHRRVAQRPEILLQLYYILLRGWLFVSFARFEGFENVICMNIGTILATRSRLRPLKLRYSLFTNLNYFIYSCKIITLKAISIQ